MGEKVFAGVSIFPHLCTTCTGGAHVHVDLAQTPHEILSGSVELPLEVERMVGQLLVAQEALNKETERLHSFVSMNCVPMH
ncbi:MAG TPA: hypothetical protein VMU25_03055 [Candidatus Paceibacterota bacterium]|nr:hypothetical protein [Candidatus Paceibacterota bacterium]